MTQQSSLPTVDHDRVEIPKWVIPACLGLSVVALAFLVWLIYINPGSSAYDVGFLAAVNACLNGGSAVCLFAGYRAIKSGNWQRHRNLMLGALTMSALFLVSYIVYHTFHGESHFLGQGFIRPVYLFILISHIGLSAICLPLILITVSCSLLKLFPIHKKWARWTFPIWAYVSVTGVLIFAMLKIFGSSSGAG